MAQDRSHAVNVLVALAYAAMSVVITFANKQVMQVYQFKLLNLLMLAQLITTVTVLYFCRAVGWLSFPNLSGKILGAVARVTIAFALYVVFSLTSLRLLNVPMWSALRRQTTLFILVAETFVLHSPSSKKIWAAVIIMQVGAIVAAYGDLEFNLAGYVHVLTLCLTSSFYFVLIRAAKRDTGLSMVGLLAHMNILAIPFVAALAFFTGEWSQVAEVSWDSHGLRLWLGVSVVVAGLMNYFAYLSIAINSALTTSVTGQAKNVVSTLLSLLLQPPARIAPSFLVGLGIGLGANMYYAYVKFQESQQPKTEEPRREQGAKSRLGGKGTASEKNSRKQRRPRSRSPAVRTRRSKP